MIKKRIGILLLPVLLLLFYSVIIVNAETVRLNKKSVTLEEEGNFRLKMLGTDKEVNWKVEDEEVATVSDKGKIGAKKVGETLVHAFVGNKKFTCKLRVVPEFKLTEVELAEELDGRKIDLLGQEFKVNGEELEDIKITSQRRSKDNKTMTVVADMDINRTIAVFHAEIELTYKNKKSSWKLSEVQTEIKSEEWNIEGLWKGETTVYDYSRNKNEDREIKLEIYDVKDDGIFNAEASFIGKKTDVVNLSGELDTETGELKITGLDWTSVESKIGKSLDSKGKVFSLYLVPDLASDSFVSNTEISKRVAFTSDTLLEKITNTEEEIQEKNENEKKEQKENQEDVYEY